MRNPNLISVAIGDLRPTQMTVGMREVQEKQRRWSQLPPEGRDEFLARHMAPVIIGPKGRYYLTDHHHLARALLEAGCKNLLVNVIADVAHLDNDAFWVFADNRAWCHPYDASGQRLTFKDIPKTIMGLSDDPYRSLAGALRRAGGYAKENTPFSEFIWADFLRRRIKPRLLENDHDRAVQKALDLARSHDAKYLPGWCGPSDDN